MRVHAHVLHEIATAGRVVMQTARATAKVHFVRELAQNLVLLKMNGQPRGNEHDHHRPEDVKGKTIGIKKMTKSMKEKEAKVDHDHVKGCVNRQPNPVLDLGHENDVVQDQEVIRQDVEVEEDK